MANLLLVQTEKNGNKIARVIENCNSLSEAKRKGLSTKNEYWDKFENLNQCLNQAKEFSTEIKRIKL